MRIETDFAIGERVRVDGGDVVGIVTSIDVRPGPGLSNVRRYELSWFHNGDAKYCTFDEFRLTKTGPGS